MFCNSVASLKWESYPPLGTALRAIFARAEPGFTHTGAFRTFVDCYEIFFFPTGMGLLKLVSFVAGEKGRWLQFVVPCSNSDVTSKCVE